MSFTLTSVATFQEEIKKSRFQAFAVPVFSEQEIKDVLERYKDITTTHQCWAWKIHDQVRFNDDGEPSGTAGRPILASIEGNDLSNILVLVNRWYGGVKLGTGGLVRAYGGCAGQCLLLAEKIELIEKKKVSFNCQFNEWAILQYELNQHQIEFEAEYLATGVAIVASVQTHQIPQLAIKIQDITRGREQLNKLDEPAHD